MWRAADQINRAKANDYGTAVLQEDVRQAQANGKKAAQEVTKRVKKRLQEANEQIVRAEKDLKQATKNNEVTTALKKLRQAQANARRAKQKARTIASAVKELDADAQTTLSKEIKSLDDRIEQSIKNEGTYNNVGTTPAKQDKSITNLRKAMVEVEKAQRELQNASPEVVGSNPETIKLAQENLQKAKKKAKLAAQIANKRFKALVENAAKDLEQAQRELFGASSVNAAADKLQQAKKRLKQLRQKVSKIAKAEESLGVSATPIQNIAGINACLKNLDIDLPVLKNVSQLCKKAIQKSLKPKQFSLSITKNGDECTVQPKWAKQIPLKSKEALECLGLKAQSQLGEAIEKDPPYTLSSPDEEIRILYKDKKILTGNCRKGLELILETSDDDDEDEDKKKNEEEDDEEEKKVKTFHQCQWSIRYHGNDISLAGSEDDGLTIKGEDGFKVSVENEGKVNCDIVKGKYDCLHEIDDSSHSVALSVSKGDESKSETCKIPSRQELMEELGMVPLLPVTPVTPPKPIRYNFGGAILSPEVY